MIEEKIHNQQEAVGIRTKVTSCEGLYWNTIQNRSEIRPASDYENSRLLSHISTSWRA